MARQGVDRQLTQYDEKGLADYLLHDRDGALADERDGLSMGTYSVASCADGGAGCVKADCLTEWLARIRCSEGECRTAVLAHVVDLRLTEAVTKAPRGSGLLRCLRHEGAEKWPKGFAAALRALDLPLFMFADGQGERHFAGALSQWYS
jgi:hypothetical protein